jgi:secreted PhoX family phosphatase
VIRRNLVLFSNTYDGRSNRSNLTCQYKCGNACAHEVPNTSDNEYFGDIVRSAITRRGLLKAGATAAVVVGAGSALAACGEGSAANNGDRAAAAGAGDATPPAGTNFETVAPNTEDAVVVPKGYEQSVVIRWGDPVIDGAPAFDFNAQTPAAAAQQFGFNNDFASLLPIEGTPNSFWLVTNHEYTTEPMMFLGYDKENPTREQFEIALASHGLSVVEVAGESGSGKLTPKFGKYNRRITGSTEFVVTGPAAGSPLLQTAADPTGTKVLGTLNNCSGGTTPWGTILSGEENFNQYFGNTDKITDPKVAEALKRYGFVSPPDPDRKWERFDARFDLAQTPNEANRFGYVVEIDPWDPNSTPIKHSALGRFKHEAASIYVTTDGTVVAYTGDDERFDYMYKFVSSRKMQSGNDATAMRHNLTILDAGTLYVAKLSGEAPAASGKVPADGFSGTGEWIKLLTTNEDGTAESHVEGMAPDEVAVLTRLAADKAGATKMDRPEDFEANPKTGKVYAALTNNVKRGIDGKDGFDAANPRNENKNGQVVELDDDHAGTKFTWSLLLVCGDPKEADTYFGGFDKTKVSPISCPDNVAFDDHGNLWISTDGNALKSNDGLFAVVTEGTNRGETKQFLTVPAGAETCGPVVTAQRVLVSVQHPGESDEATAEKPTSRWPDGAASQPRPAVVAVWNPKGHIGE